MHQPRAFQMPKLSWHFLYALICSHLLPLCLCPQDVTRCLPFSDITVVLVMEKSCNKHCTEAQCFICNLSVLSFSNLVIKKVTSPNKLIGYIIWELPCVDIRAPMCGYKGIQVFGIYFTSVPGFRIEKTMWNYKDCIRQIQPQPNVMKPELFWNWVNFENKFLIISNNSNVATALKSY